MKEKSFELEDYKGVVVKGNEYYPKVGKLVGSTNYAYYFRRDFPQHAEHIKKPSTITRIIEKFHENTIDAAIENRKGAELPERLGVIFLGKYKGENIIDHATSMKYKKKIMFRNLHTDGYVASIEHDHYTDKCNFTHRDLWMFTATTSFRKKVSQDFIQNWKRYLNLENFRKIVSIAKKSGLENFLIKKEEGLLKGYNEFYVS